MLVSKIKVSEVRRIYKNHDTFYTLKPLNSILRLVGLSCIFLDNRKLKSSSSLLKYIVLLLLLALLNAFNVYRKLQIMEGQFSLTFKDFVQVIFLLGYLQYAVDLFFVHKYGREICLEYFNIFDHIDNILGMNYYKNIRNQVIRLMITLTAIGAVSTFFDVGAWFASCGTIFMGVNMIDYLYVLMRQLTVSDHIAQVIQIEYRLKCIKDLLLDYYLSCETLPGIIKDVVAEKDSNMNKNKIKNKRSINYVQAVDQNESTVLKLGNCYLLILEQTHYINSMYGIRIMGVCLNTLIDLITLMNAAIRIIMGTIKISYLSGALPAVSSVIRILYCSSMLLCGMYRCEQAYNESENIIRLIYHTLHCKKISTEMRESLQKLRDTMSARPVEFHAVNFYKLDYALLLSVSSVFVTYTIIFLQNLK